MTQQRQPNFTVPSDQNFYNENERVPALRTWQKSTKEDIDWTEKIDYYFWPATSWLAIGAVLVITCIAISGMWNNGYNPLIAWSVTANFILVFAGIAAIYKYLLKDENNVRRDD